ncbi:NAD-dependent epimerase/dehydratase family protein [Sphingobacterium sp.]|uniref:NAD-dependent epimerase/dehydratase family protein n=1 Tax=Sphingobacterium sp. TaxID=341027 RepID=UPI0031CFA83A
MTTNSIIKEDLEEIYNSDIDWKKFYNTTVLITGASGVLPGYLVETLLYINQLVLNANIKIIALVRNRGNAENRFAAYLDDPHLSFIEQDVSSPLLVKEKVDYIIHAASQASPVYYGVDPVGTLKANVIGTVNLLELARKKNVKSFLYFSSAEVYGDCGDKSNSIEESSYGYLDPISLRSCYGESKRMGENICVSFYHQFGIPTKIVRPFHTYGPGMKLDDGRVYADFVSNILSNNNIILNSDGSSRRAFCYLSDATIAFFKVLLDGENGNSYNVGNPSQEFSVLELAELIVRIFPEKGLLVNSHSQDSKTEYLKNTISSYIPNIEKIKKLNWNPKISAMDGFKRTILSYNYNNESI